MGSRLNLFLMVILCLEYLSSGENLKVEYFKLKRVSRFSHIIVAAFSNTARALQVITCGALYFAPPGWVSTEGGVARRVGFGQCVDPVPLLRHVVHQVHSEAVLLKVYS